MKEEISHAEMVKVLCKPGVEIAEDMTGERAHLIHMVLGIAGEVGELALAIRFDLQSVAERENLVEELGDLMFYIQGIRQTGLITDNDLSSPPKGFTALEYLSIGSGDLVDAVKKFCIYNKPIDVEAVEESVRKILWGVVLIQDKYRIVTKEIIAANIKKLSVRYNGFKYSDTAAQARADKTIEKPEPIAWLEPIISIDRGSKKYAIFNETDLVKDFTPFVQDEFEIIAIAEAWIEARTAGARPMTRTVIIRCKTE